MALIIYFSDSIWIYDIFNSVPNWIFTDINNAYKWMDLEISKFPIHSFNCPLSSSEYFMLNYNKFWIDIEFCVDGAGGIGAINKGIQASKVAV